MQARVGQRLICGTGAMSAARVYHVIYVHIHMHMHMHMYVHVTCTCHMYMHMSYVAEDYGSRHARPVFYYY